MGLAMAGSAMAAPSDIESQSIEAFYVTSISDNGKWVMGQADSGEGAILVKDLVNNKVIVAGQGSMTGTGYIAPAGKGISNDGIVISLYNGLPYVWVNGKWSQLPGKAMDGSAMLGSISADGSMIVGAIGESGLSTDDRQTTYPCIWYRQADGKYGNPVFLPNPGKDPFGLVPQMVNAISMSADGKVIAATMTDNSGFYEIPFVYVQDADGNWTYKDLGSKLLNPKGREFPGYWPDIDAKEPNPWNYLTRQEQLDAYRDAFDEWNSQEPQASIDYESYEYYYLWWDFIATFMDEADAEKFMAEVEAFKKVADDKKKWDQDWIDFREGIRMEGMPFMMNNACVSPDGQYAYFTGIKTIIVDPTLGIEGIKLNHVPVRFDVTSGEYVIYENEENLVVTSVSGNNDILCRQIGLDDYSPVAGWIFPEGKENGMILPDYLKEKVSAETYTWMEDNMYLEVIVGANDNGSLRYDDAWNFGIPYCTPDMSLITGANSTMYWADEEINYNYITFIVNTGMEVSSDDTNGIENGIDVANANVTLLGNGSLSIEGNVAFLTVYDISGTAVYRAANPSGTVDTGLPKGVYVINAVTSTGEVITKKAIF